MFKKSEENAIARAEHVDKQLGALAAQLAPIQEQLQNLGEAVKIVTDAHAQIEKRVKVIEKRLEKSNSGADADIVHANELIRDLAARSEVLNHKCFFEYAKVEGMSIPSGDGVAPEVAFYDVLTACIPSCAIA